MTQAALYFIAAAVMLALASLGYGQWERASRIQAQADLTVAERLLKNNEAELARLQEERRVTVTALEQVTASMRESSENLRSARSVVNAAPRTNSCVALAGVRALRSSLLARNAGNPSGQPGAAR